MAARTDQPEHAMPALAAREGREDVEADRGAAVITGRPSALASALLKISGTMQRIPQQDLRTAEGLNAFYIIPAKTKQSISNIFSTHPPVEQRIARLQRLEEQLQGTAAHAA